MVAETLVPLALVALLAVLLPEVFASYRSLSQRRLAGAMGLTAMTILLAGTVMMAVLYVWQGSRVAAGFATYPLATLRYFLAASLRLVPFWAPLLALIWLIKAQAVEQRRGQALAAEGLER